MISAVAVAITMGGVGLAAPAAASTAGLYSFGVNSFGELGNGTTTASSLPLPVGLPAPVLQVAAGAGASAALLANGTVWTWGNDDIGQLGYATDNRYGTTPQQVPGLSNIIQVVMVTPGDGYALGADGTVWAWGSNTRGQLGNGSIASAFAPGAPARVPGLDGVTEVAAGDAHVLVRRSDGTVAGWGENDFGELGDGTTQTRLTPVQVPGLTGITEIATAVASYAVRSDGTLFSWGGNGGLLGNGTTGEFTTSPAPISLTGVTKIATGLHSTLALVGSTGRIYAWGDNTDGELGDGTTVAKSAPELLGLTGVTQVAVSNNIFQPSGAAIRADGTLWTWGSNQSGQLDNGTPPAGTATPTAVANLAGVSQYVLGDEQPPGNLFDCCSFSLVIGSIAQVAVPRLTGDTRAQATAALQAARLTVGTVSNRVDSTCNNIGKVISQSPAAGSNLMVGLAVSFALGQSPAPPHQCP